MSESYRIRAAYKISRFIVRSCARLDTSSSHLAGAAPLLVSQFPARVNVDIIPSRARGTPILIRTNLFIRIRARNVETRSCACVFVIVIRRETFCPITRRPEGRRRNINKLFVFRTGPFIGRSFLGDVLASRRVIYIYIYIVTSRANFRGGGETHARVLIPSRPATVYNDITRGRWLSGFPR